MKKIYSNKKKFLFAQLKKLEVDVWNKISFDKK